MKKIDDILKDRRIQKKQLGVDGMSGWITLKGKSLVFVASFGGGWDHVSVSLANRCPTWDEMCEVKDIFFDEHETCVEYHPAKQDYVNVYPYCLHIWRPQDVELPKPPKIFV